MVQREHPVLVESDAPMMVLAENAAERKDMVRGEQSVAKPFRIAIVGLGEVAGYHIAAIDSMRETMQIVVGVVTSEERRATFEGYSVSTLDELTFSAVDAVVIATPTTTHCQLATQALLAGCAVLIEKPAVTSKADWDTLLEAANNSGAAIHTALHARYAPERRWFGHAKRWLIAEHGPICAFHSQAFDPYAQSDSLPAKVKSLAGSWLDSGINVLSGLDSMLEEWTVESVRRIGALGIRDTAATATVRFSRRGLEHAGFGIVETSWHSHHSWKETVLFFEESGARLHLLHSKHRAELRTPNGELQVLFDTPPQRRRLYTHYEGVYRDFAKVLLGQPDNRALSERLHRALLMRAGIGGS